MEDYVHLVKAGGPVLHVPKTWVPALSEKWTKQEYLEALPVNGSLCNYRWGRYHVHEMGDHFEMHQDFYDPKRNPLRHLFADTQKMMAGAFLAAYAAMSLFLLFRLRKKSKQQRPECVKRFFYLSLMLNIIIFGLFLYLIWVRITRCNPEYGRIADGTSGKGTVVRRLLLSVVRGTFPAVEEVVLDIKTTSAWENTAVQLFADLLREITYECGKEENGYLKV